MLCALIGMAVVLFDCLIPEKMKQAFSVAVDSEEEEDMRKGRGCMLHYQHSVVRVLTPFTAQSSATPAVPDPGSEEDRKSVV